MTRTYKHTELESVSGSSYRVLLSSTGETIARIEAVDVHPSGRINDFKLTSPLAKTMVDPNLEKLHALVDDFAAHLRPLQVGDTVRILTEDEIFGDAALYGVHAGQDVTVCKTMAIRPGRIMVECEDEHVFTVERSHIERR